MRHVYEWPAEESLMGVSGDVLFADPLGVRPKKADPAGGRPGSDRHAGNLNNRSGHGSTGTGKKLGSSNAVRLPDEEQDDDPSKQEETWIGSWVSYIIAGGSSCCSMRDRTKDAEAAKRAAESGRPPRGVFPPPRGAAAEDESVSPSDKASRKQEPPAPKPAIKPQPRPSVDSDIDRSRSAPSRPPEPRPEPAAVPQRWHWPSWCLNFKEPTIEVFVIDDDTGEGRWVRGVPQSRVVDKAGNDAYLCAEYDWDDEMYMEDFPPDRVRRAGHSSTVAELLSRQKAAAASAVGTTASIGSMDATRRTVDDGGGVMRFLDETG